MNSVKKVLKSIADTLNVPWTWLRRVPYGTSYMLLFVIALMFISQSRGYHLPYVPQTPSNINELPKGWGPAPDISYFALYLLSYLRLFVLLGCLVYHVHILRVYPAIEKMIKPTWIACLVLVVWVTAGQVYDYWEYQYINVSGEVLSMAAFAIHLLLICGLLFSPPLLMSYYSRGKILERYILRSFLQPLAFCFVAFATLWIVMDLLNNLQDFQQNNIGRTQIAMFYLKLIPFIYVTVAPISLLLSTLYVLGRMSRTNEIISMLGIGKSIAEVLQPIYIVALFASFLGIVANYEMAPTAAGNKEKLLENVKDRMSGNIMVMAMMYKNVEARRTWFVGSVPQNFQTDSMRRVEVHQEDEHGHLQKAWIARTVRWWPDAKIWSFYNGVEITYNNGQVVSMNYFDYGDGYPRVDVEGWSETPWVLVSGSLVPDFLGVPELISYIYANDSYGHDKLSPYWTHLFYRFSLPVQCLIVVMFAAPLSLVFSRRGLVGGMASAVIFFFIMIFLDNMFLNLGKGQHIPAIIAVWIPHLLLGSVGVYLYYMRAQNRELPKFTLKPLRDFFSNLKGSKLAKV